MTEETTTEQLAEIEGQAEPIQVREGRWRTRSGEVKNIRPCEPLKGAYYVWPWTDGFMTFQDNGRHLAAVSDNDLVEYLGPIELQPQPQPQAEPEPEPQPEPEPVPHAAAIEELRSEVSYVQRLLGESRQRVTHLEELVASLRTINEGQEKAFTAAGKENTALQNQLAAVKAELATKAETSRRLQMELDAAQQVPADSPELRQLRADLAEVTRERDQYRHCYDEVSSHLETIEKTAKAEAVEAIAEWLQPIQAAIAAADNVAESTRAGWLAEEVIQHLPKIMRSLTGLADEDIE